MATTWIIRPHATNKDGNRHELLDLVTVNPDGSETPWALLHIDAFYDSDSSDLHERLYRGGETVYLQLVEVTEAGK